MIAALAAGFAIGAGIGWIHRQSWPAPAPSLPAENLFRVNGLIDINPKLKKRVKPSDVLFLVVRLEGQAVPYAVKKIAPVSFPLQYAIGPEDRMLGEASEPLIPGRKISLVARLDHDGEVAARPGDLEGSPAEGSFELPADSLHLLIDRVVK